MEKKRQIVNIVNFIRAIEPREAADWDLLKPVKEQIRLIDQYQFSATFLVQYDALLLPEYQALLKGLDPTRYELGVWYEVVQPLTQACRIAWRGRWPWDSHCDCGFPVGYTNIEREALATELFEGFFRVFGYYPKVLGSWFFDSHTIRYVSDHYGLDALCNCKEQYGTDGYTLWGGYYGQGYYPSRQNVFMPAQDAKLQLPVPLFRMLGSDPVYQYDFGMDVETGASRVQGVITLEPVYPVGGGGAGWVDWFLKENFNGECLSFGYAQAGQENSFGWEAMKDGLVCQFERFAKLVAQGKLEIESLGATGRWFRRTFALTPASTITAHSAYDDEKKNTAWYCSRFYRVNFYSDKGGFRLRDIHVFRQDFPDPYEDKICTGNAAVYETLPVADGNLFSGNGTVAGLYLKEEPGGAEILCSGMIFEELGDNRAKICFGEGKEATVVLLWENRLEIQRSRNFILENRIGSTDIRLLPQVVELTDKKIVLQYHGVSYGLALETGTFLNAKTVVSEDGVVRIRLGDVR